MLRRVYLLFLIVLIAGMIGSAFARPNIQPDLATQSRWVWTETNKIIKPDSPMPTNSGVFHELDRLNPRRDPVGETAEVGETYYDYQHNGTISKMIALDPDGGIHVTWMKSYDSGQARRRMAYNWYDPDAEEWLEPRDGGIVVDNSNRAGYGHVTILPEDGRAVVFCHSQPNPLQGDEYLSTMCVDFAPGIGAFESAYAPTWPNEVFLIWPKGAISQNNTAHMLATENSDEGVLFQRIGYWSGEATDRDFQEWEWTEPPINVDTASAITTIVSSSRTSDKIVMAWHHNRVGADVGPWEAVGGAYQRNNDIRYVIMEEGEEYDPDEHEVMSMTKIIPPDPDNFQEDVDFDPLDPENPDEGYGDIWRPYCDVDIQLDPWDDEPYGVFATCAMYERPFVNDEGDIIDGMTGEHDMLWFWNSQEDTLTLIANGYYFNRTNNGGNWHSRCGGWRMNADRGSIAFDPENEGMVYVTWVSFQQIMELSGEDDPPFDYDNFEFAADTSGDGYSNAEIMVSISDDYGITWKEAVNITNTHYEGENPRPGDSESEAWQSVAVDVYDEALHLTYVKDIDAGGIPQNEGSSTLNPVMYQNVPLEDLNFEDLDDLELPYEGFIFHNYPEARPVIYDVIRDPGVPVTDQSVTVTATVTSGDEDVELTQVDLIYITSENEHIDEDDVTTVQMEAGEGDTYSATIPAQSEGTRVAYKISATNDLENETLIPRNYYYMYTVRDEGDLSIYDVQFRPELWENASDASPYRGYEVTVTGIVTTPPTFNDAFDAYVIQDARDLWSAVFIRNIDDDLDVGAEVTVTGIVMERDPEEARKWQYATYIDVSEYEVISDGNDIFDPLPIETNDMQFSELGEELEGVLVYIANAQVDTLEDFGAEFRRGQLPIRDVSDVRGWLSGLGLTQEQKDLCGGGGFDSYNFETEFNDITGVITESYGHYAITPRSAGDLGGVGVEGDGSTSPHSFSLNTAYPNPFNGTTTVSFDIARLDVVHLALYDVNGRIALDLFEKDLGAGSYQYPVDASSLSTGVYVLRLQTPDASASQKVVLVK